MEFVSEDLARRLRNKGCPNWAYCDTLYIPTISEALTWLRTERNIDIVIYPIDADASTLYMGGEKYILSVYVNAKRILKIHYDNIDKYVKWEDAAVAGIEYALDNLF